MNQQTFNNVSSPLRRPSKFSLVTFGALLVPIWMLLHPYLGLVHDTNLYTLAALARLHPEHLANDIFLRFGSQDQYTLFSPLFAGTIRLLDLEPAAAILTIFNQVAFFTAAWLLLRRFMPTNMALLSIGLLLVLPNGYGAFKIFGYIEPFLTPRQLSEALVLLSVVAAITHRYLWSGLLLLLAVLMHPIIAAAGIAILMCLFLVIPRPRLAMGLAVAAALLVIALVVLSSSGPFNQFDDTWLKLIIDRSRFLFLSWWSLEDWRRNAVPLGILCAGMLIAKDAPVRTMARAALVTALGGLGLTLVTCDLLHIVIFTQMQPWRWLWLTNMLAVLLLPLIARDCWRINTMSRAALIVLLTGWILSNPVAGILAIATAITLLLSRERIAEPNVQRLILVGAGAAFIGAFLLNLADSFSLMTLDDSFFDLRTPIVLQKVRYWAQNSMLSTVILGLLWWLAQTRRVGWPVSSFLLALMAVITLLPSSWHNWTNFKFSAEMHRQYAQARTQLPPDAEVLWPDTPIGAWYLLDRPSYISGHQTAGIVFSRQTALELNRRAMEVASLLPRDTLRDWAGKEALDIALALRLPTVCGQSRVRFIASWDDLLQPAALTVTPHPERPQIKLRLYDCSAIRS